MPYCTETSVYKCTVLCTWQPTVQNFTGGGDDEDWEEEPIKPKNYKTPNYKVDKVFIIKQYFSIVYNNNNVAQRPHYST